MLDKESLKEIGITKVGDRLRIQILILLLNAEKVRTQIPIHQFSGAVKLGYSALMGISNEILKKTGERNRNSEGTGHRNTVVVITQNGKEHTVDITNCFTSSAIKRNILRQTGVSGPPIVDEWSTYYIDKESSVHLMFNIELATICNSPGREEKKRIIFCRTGEAPSSSAVRKSNRILALSNSHKRSNRDSTDSMMVRNIMGQRPPSQLISTNLGQYFPDIGPSELKKVMRNSYRMSIYGSKIMRRQSMQSIGSGISLGTALPGSRNSIYSNYSGIGDMHSMRLNQTVGDVLLSNNNAIDEDELPIEEESESESGGETDTSNTDTETEDNDDEGKANVATIVSGDQKSFIQLLDDDDDSDEFLDSFDNLSLEWSIPGDKPKDEKKKEVTTETVAPTTKDKPKKPMERPRSDNGIANILAYEMMNGPSVWHKGSKIGQGSYGSVYLGLDGLTGELMAVKEVDLPTSSEDSRNRMVDALKREMGLLRELHHENIVRYLGSTSDSKKMYIFLEYIPGGSVSSMLRTYGPFEEPLVRNFLTQVLIGVRYLHSNNIIHRDIKGANILIDINGTVKIGDFGISKKIAVKNEKLQDNSKLSKQQKRASFQGSVYWMAPEVVKQTASTEKSDIWSVGCLAIEMFTAEHPYADYSQMQAIFRIGGLNLPDYPANCSGIARSFLNLTFETDYRKRVNASTLLKHPFLKPLFNLRRKAHEQHEQQQIAMASR